MVHPSLIEARLGKLGFKTSRWFKAEINELQHVLMDDEEIISLACGRYFGSFALLVATDQRLLLIDKRVFFMTIEDTRYDMISEIDYNSQAYMAAVSIYTMNKTHRFTSVKYRRQLRELTNYVQRRVWEFRQQQPGNNEVPQAVASPSYQPSRQSAQTTSYYSQPQVVPTHPRLGHIAHLVGSSATRATHRAPRYSPYSQGSIVTRKPISGAGQVR